MTTISARCRVEEAKAEDDIDMMMMTSVDGGGGGWWPESYGAGFVADCVCTLYFLLIVCSRCRRPCLRDLLQYTNTACACGCHFWYVNEL